MQRTWLWKTVSCLGTFLILYTIHIIRVPQATAEAYKLGKVYYNCLETHSGAVSSSTGCSCATDKECLARGHGRYCNTSINICQQCKDGRDDNWCRDNFGEDYICMNGMCAIAECETTPDCTAKMGHMFSCNTISHRCYVSCNWDIITAQGKGNVASLNMIKEMQNEKAILRLPNRSSYSFVNERFYYSGGYPYLRDATPYTCISGEVKPCPQIRNNSTSNSSIYCLPCIGSEVSGPAYGINTMVLNEATVGPRPYWGKESFATNRKAAGWVVPSSEMNVSHSGDTFMCVTETALNLSANAVDRWNYSQEYIGRVYWDKSNFDFLSGYSFEMIAAPRMCAQYGFDPLYQWHSDGNFKGSGLSQLILMHPQDKKINIFSGSSQGSLVNNYPLQFGALFCCMRPDAGGYTAASPRKPCINLHAP